MIVPLTVYGGLVVALIVGSPVFWTVWGTVALGMCVYEGSKRSCCRH
jgi:hypothetical protein